MPMPVHLVDDGAAEVGEAVDTSGSSVALSAHSLVLKWVSVM